MGQADHGLGHAISRLLPLARFGSLNLFLETLDFCFIFKDLSIFWCLWCAPWRHFDLAWRHLEIGDDRLAQTRDVRIRYPAEQDGKGNALEC